MTSRKIKVLKIAGLRMRQAIAKQEANNEADPLERDLLYNRAREFGAKADRVAQGMTLYGRVSRLGRAFLILLRWAAIAFVIGALLAAGQSTAERVWPRPHSQIDINYPEVE